MWVAVTSAILQATAAIFQHVCSLDVTFMCGHPWHDEQDGHADVGQHREHHDIDTVVPSCGFRDAPTAHSARYRSCTWSAEDIGNSTNGALSPQLQLSSCDHSRPTERATAKCSPLKLHTVNNPTL